MPALEDRLASSAAEKRAIGRTTAALVEDGDTVLIDGGTTTVEVARALLGRPVQVVTNSIPIAKPDVGEQAGRRDPDRRLRLAEDRGRDGAVGRRDDAGHPGPQVDPRGGRASSPRGCITRTSSWSRPSGR